MRIEYVGTDPVAALNIIKIDSELHRALAEAALVMSGHSPAELHGNVEVQIDYRPLWSLLDEIARYGHSPGQHLRIEQTRTLVVKALEGRDA